MDSKFTLIVPIGFILLCSAFIISTNKNPQLVSSRFNLSLITPTPQKQLLSPTPTTEPTQAASPTPTPNYQKYLTIDKVYTSSQIAFFKTHNVYQYLASTKFPPLPKSSSGKQYVYMMNCTNIKDKPYYQLVPSYEAIPTTGDKLFNTMNIFAQKGYGQFPTVKEIAQRAALGTNFKTKLGGVNQVTLDPTGLLYVNYYDSVAAYNGGSSRVQCMSLAALTTAMQFKEVAGVKACIDEMPTSPASCPDDFQP